MNLFNYLRSRFRKNAKPALAEELIALNAAVRSSDTESIKRLVSTSPELLTTPDEKGEFPLHWAAEAQTLVSVACLLDLGADASQKDRLGYTPADVAHWNGEFRMGAYTDVCLQIVARLGVGEPHEPPSPGS